MASIKSQMLRSWNDAFESNNKALALEASQLTQAESFGVTFTFAFPTLKSCTLAQKNAKLWGFQSYNIKPDFDNLEKLYADCATGIFWPDDCQIVFTESKKYYTENPRTEIEIVALKELKVSPTAENALLVFGPSRMKEFLTDILQFTIYPDEFLDHLISTENRLDNEISLNNLGMRIAEFAAKYADELKKIKKL